MIILILLLISIGGPLLISFIGYKIIKKYYPKKALILGLIIFVIPYLIIAILIYIGNNPGEVFYAEEFHTITELELPNSAYSDFKKATSSDFQIEYISAAAIRLHKDDYKKLLSKIRSSKKLTGRMDYASETYNWIRDKIGNPEYLFYASSNKENNYHFIGFCEDRETIIIHLVVW